MTQYKEKKVAGVLSTTNNQTSSLIKKIQQLSQLNLLLAKILATELAAHCKIANFREQILIIETDSAAWATQLQYQIPRLLTALKQIPQLKELKKIEWYIKPSSILLKPVIKSLHLSEQSAQLLAETAQHINAPALQRALLRLAKHTTH